MKKSTVTLKCKSAFMFEGELIAPGRLADGVPAGEADSLVRRGKAARVDHAPSQPDAHAASTPDDDQPLDEMTVPELKELAAEYDIAGAAQMKKADLVSAIETAEAEAE